MTLEASVTIRWAAPSDAMALTPLLEALYAHEAPDIQDMPNEIALLHATQLLNATNPHRLAVAWTSDGVAVGLASVAIFLSVSDPRPSHWRQMELKELFVLPEHRGAHVGSALMSWIEREASAAGACRIDWHVRRDNERGIVFYRRLGAHILEGRASMRKPLAEVDRGH